MTVTLKLVNVTKPSELRTNALYWDTDKDGVVDGKDFDPLHDLVVQVHVRTFIAHDGTCGSDCSTARYQAVATVGPNWTKSKDAGIETYAIVDHDLSVNVRDDATVTAKVQVFRSAFQGIQTWTELDVNSTAG